MSGKGNVCADEEPEGNRKRKVMSVRESGGVGQVGEQNENCCSQMSLWYKQIAYSFHQEKGN